MILHQKALKEFNPPQGLTALLDLFKDYPKDYMIGGGAARQIYLQDNNFGSTDIDIFTKSYNRYNNIDKILKKVGQELEIDYTYAQQAKSYFIPDIGKVQLISQFYENTEVLFKSFDFHCCCFAIYNGDLWFTNDAIEDVKKKQLRHIPSGRLTSNRIIKYYLKKGYVLADTRCKNAFNKKFLQFIRTPGMKDHQIKKFADKGQITYDWENPCDEIILAQEGMQAAQVAQQGQIEIAEYIDRWVVLPPSNPMMQAAQAQVQLNGEIQWADFDIRYQAANIQYIENAARIQQAMQNVGIANPEQLINPNPFGPIRRN